MSEVVLGKNENLLEPISESAPTWANGSEERKPEGNGCHKSKPDLEIALTDKGRWQVEGWASVADDERSVFGLTALSQVRTTDRLPFRASRILLRATATKTTSTTKTAVVSRAAGKMIAKLMIEVKRDRPSRSVPYFWKWRRRR